MCCFPSSCPVGGACCRWVLTVSLSENAFDPCSFSRGTATGCTVPGGHALLPLLEICHSGRPHGCSEGVHLSLDTGSFMVLSTFLWVSLARLLSIAVSPFSSPWPVVKGVFPPVSHPLPSFPSLSLSVLHSTYFFQPVHECFLPLWST